MLMGIVFPIAGLVFLWIVNQIWVAIDPVGMNLPIRERTLLLLIICLNLIPFRRFNHFRKIASLRGVVLVTVALAFIWIFRYYATLID